jgi:hypothetical protein
MGDTINNGLESMPDSAEGVTSETRSALDSLVSQMPQIAAETETTEATRYRVAWRTKTGETGHGEYLDRDLAEATVTDANKRHKDIDHWLEPEPSTSD